MNKDVQKLQERVIKLEEDNKKLKWLNATKDEITVQVFNNLTDKIKEIIKDSAEAAIKDLFIKYGITTPKSIDNTAVR